MPLPPKRTMIRPRITLPEWFDSVSPSVDRAGQVSLELDERRARKPGCVVPSILTGFVIVRARPVGTIPGSHYRWRSHLVVDAVGSRRGDVALTRSSR